MSYFSPSYPSHSESSCLELNLSSYDATSNIFQSLAVAPAACLPHLGEAAEEAFAAADSYPCRFMARVQRLREVWSQCHADLSAREVGLCWLAISCTCTRRSPNTVTLGRKTPRMGLILAHILLISSDVSVSTSHHVTYAHAAYPSSIEDERVL